MELKNSVAIVTGGSSGLGEATVKAYLAKGAKTPLLAVEAMMCCTEAKMTTFSMEMAYMTGTGMTGYLVVLGVMC